MRLFQRRNFAIRFRKLTVPILVLAFLAACDDDDDGGGMMNPGPGNQPPSAAVTAAPTTVPTGDNHTTVVTIDASGSTDPDGDPLSFSWTVPSGRFVNNTSASDPTIEVTFPGVAPYNVVVVVSDGNGGEDSASITIGLR